MHEDKENAKHINIYSYLYFALMMGRDDVNPNI